MDHEAQTEATRATMQAFYARYVERDFDAFAALLAEDIDWGMEAPQSFLPFAGPRRGRAAVVESLKLLVGGFEHLRYDVERILADGESACTYVTADVRSRETGATVTSAMCDLARVRDGKVVWFREFFDSLAAFHAMVGVT